MKNHAKYRTFVKEFFSKNAFHDAITLKICWKSTKNALNCPKMGKKEQKMLKIGLNWSKINNFLMIYCTSKNIEKYPKNTVFEWFWAKNNTFWVKFHEKTPKLSKKCSNSRYFCWCTIIKNNWKSTKINQKWLNLSEIEQKYCNLSEKTLKLSKNTAFWLKMHQKKCNSWCLYVKKITKNNQIEPILTKFDAKLKEKRLISLNFNQNWTKKKKKETNFSNLEEKITSHRGYFFSRIWLKTTKFCANTYCSAVQCSY